MIEWLRRYFDLKLFRNFRKCWFGVSLIWTCDRYILTTQCISAYLDSGQNNLLLHPQSGLLCGAALSKALFFRKTTCLVFCNLKLCFLNSIWKIFNGTRLDRRGLKSLCVRFQYGTKCMTRKFENWSWTFFDYTFGTFTHPCTTMKRQINLDSTITMFLSRSFFPSFFLSFMFSFFVFFLSVRLLMVHMWKGPNPFLSRMMFASPCCRGFCLPAFVFSPGKKHSWDVGHHLGDSWILWNKKDADSHQKLGPLIFSP